MRCYEQVPRRMIGELWLRTMARINSTRYIRDTCSTHTDRSIGNFFLDLLESDVLCPRIPGTLTELKKNERKREREKKKERKKKERGEKRDKKASTNHYASFIARNSYTVTLYRKWRRFALEEINDRRIR